LDFCVSGVYNFVYVKSASFCSDMPGGGEIARRDIARPDNPAPYRKGGHRKT